jgi:prevent-host-death family protein
MKQMAAGKFKARCLAVMDDVNATGEPMLITKRGVPVAKIVPVSSKKRDLFGFMAGQFEIVGDIESPTVPPEAWEVMRK